MKRKINRVGLNTLTVSLPKKWTETFNLRAGNDLDVIERGKTILITAEREKSLGKKTIEIQETSFPRRCLTLPFIQGYDEIEINYDKKDVLSHIKRIVPLLTGFEITKESQRSCTLKLVAEAMDSEFEPLANRLINITLTMLRESLDALKGNNYEELKIIRNYESETNKIDLFCRRMLNQRILLEKNQLSIYAIIRYFEAITDALRDICDWQADNKSQLNEELFSLFETVISQFELFLQAYRRNDEGKILEMKKIEMQVKNKYLSLRLKNTYWPISNSLIQIHFLIRHASEELNAV